MLSVFSSPRRALIVAHDLLMTALAVVASCYIRFEAVGVEERLDTLYSFLPAFVIYAGVVYFLFHLYEAKWRFASLPDLMNIVRASSVMAVSLLIVDYFLVAPNVFGQYFFGKITIALYWVLQIVLLSGSRMAYRYFRYTRTRQHARSPQSNPTLILGRAADAEVLLRGIESGAITNIWPAGILSSSPADRGQSIRGIAVRGNFEMLDNVVNDLAQRGTTITRVIFTPSALDPAAKPEATLMRARRLGLTVSRLPSLDDGGEPPRLAPVNVEDLLLRPSVKIDYARAGKVPAGALDRGDRRRRLDRLGNLRPRGGLRRRAAADHREFRAGLACRPGDARHQAHAAHDHRPHRRRARPRAAVPAAERLQAGYRFPRCGAQARAALGSRTGRRGSRPTCSARSMSPMRRPRPEPPRW